MYNFFVHNVINGARERINDGRDIKKKGKMKFCTRNDACLPDSLFAICIPVQFLQTLSQKCVQIS